MYYQNPPEPCLCGADDCRQCHPENFWSGGMYAAGEDDDSYDYDPGDWGDEGRE